MSIQFKTKCIILMFICSSISSYASVAKQMTLVGEIVSFDQNHVKVKSGKQEYTFSKEELDHPNYIVGNRIEIPYDVNKMKKAKIKGNKSDKNLKSPSV